MDGVGSAFDLHVDCSSSRQTLLRIKAVGDDVDGLDRLQCGNVSRYVGEPNVVLAGAVNADVVGAVRRAIYVERQSSRRVGWNRVGILMRGDSRQRRK